MLYLCALWLYLCLSMPYSQFTRAKPRLPLFHVAKSKGSSRFVASYVARESEERLIRVVIDAATEVGD